MRIEIEVHGEEAVLARMEALPDKLRQALVRKVSVLTLQLEDHVKSKKLSGQVLNVVTGRLRRSIFSTVTVSADAVEGDVRSSGDVKYAAIHEFGFSGPETVREHTRTIKTAFGREISPKEVVVREHVREMNMPERSFLRSSFNDLKGVLQQGLRDAIAEGTRP